MGGQSSAGPPPPSAAEKRLQREQAELLRQQRQLLEQSRRQAAALEPVLLRQAGLERVFVGATPKQDARRKQLLAEQKKLKAQDKLKPHQMKRLEAIGTELKGLPGRWKVKETAEFAADRERRKALEALQIERETKSFESDEAKRAIEQQFLEQQLAALEAEAPLRRQREAIEALSLERQEKALKGELPIDVGLLKDLGTRETQTRERLRAQLGAGYETSTPGIEALREFETFRGGVLEQARRGEIDRVQPLGSPQVGFGYQPTSRYGYAPSESTVALSAPFAGAYGSLAQGYGQAASAYTQSRFAGYQPQQQTGAGLGSALGLAAGIAGSWFTGGTSLAAVLGAGAQGAAAGGVAGSFF